MPTKSGIRSEELYKNLVFCYENEFYKEGVKLFSLINEDGLDKERWKKAKKIAEVCRIKI